MNARLRYATFNFCLTPCWPWQVREGEARVRAFVERFLKGADDVSAWLFQEVWDVPGGHRWSAVVERAMRSQGYRWFAVSRASRSCCWASNPGLMIASRVPIVDSGSHTFRSSSGLQRWLPHGVLWARLSDGSLLASTHMHAPTEDTWLCNSTRTARRIQQAQLLELLNEISRQRGESQALVVVGGDFNMEGEELRPLVSRYGLSIATAGLPTYPYPRDGRSPLVNAKFAHRDCYIDHFLVGGYVTSPLGVGVSTSCVAPLGVDDRARRRSGSPLWISDHAALFVELDMHVG